MVWQNVICTNARHTTYKRKLHLERRMAAMMRLADRKRHIAKSEGGYGCSYIPRPIQTRTQHLEQLEAREAAVEVGCTWGVGGVYIGCTWGVHRVYVGCDNHSHCFYRWWNDNNNQLNQLNQLSQFNQSQRLWSYSRNVMKLPKSLGW